MMARPTCVPPPSGGPDSVFRPWRPVSPPYSPDMSPMSMSRHRLVARGIVVSLVQAQMLGLYGTTFGTLHNYAFLSQLQQLGVVTLAPATTTLSGPPFLSTRTLLLLPALPWSVGLRPTEPPKTVLAHGAIGRLPFPVHTAQMRSSTPNSTQRRKVL